MEIEKELEHYEGNMLTMPEYNFSLLPSNRQWDTSGKEFSNFSNNFACACSFYVLKGWHSSSSYQHNIHITLIMLRRKHKNNELSARGMNIRE